MDPENFVYWLQGFFEITGKPVSLNEEQTKMVKDHLEYVFQHMAAKNQTIHPRSLFGPSSSEKLIC